MKYDIVLPINKPLKLGIMPAEDDKVPLTAELVRAGEALVRSLRDVVIEAESSIKP